MHPGSLEHADDHKGHLCSRCKEFLDKDRSGSIAYQRQSPKTSLQPSLPSPASDAYHGTASHHKGEKDVCGGNLFPFHTSPAPRAPRPLAQDAHADLHSHDLRV